jgi:uncharacterized Zn finger protein
MNFAAASLRPLAGSPAYQRGEAYFAEGRVRVLRHGEHGAQGEVIGTEAYRCQLSWKTPTLEFDCNCPVGDRGECCKHVVALALTVEQPSAQKQHPSKRSSGLAQFLRKQPVAWLADTLLQLSHEHPEIARRLQIQQQLSGDVDFAALKKTVSSILGRARFLDYRQSMAYARKLIEVNDLLRQLLAANQASIAMPLCEYALERLFVIYEQSDDSAGTIGSEMHEISHIYQQACTQAADASLPKRLFKLMLADGWSIVRIEDFSDLLGASGLAEWESLLENTWANVVTKPAADTTGKKMQLQYMMEALAEKRGDVDLLIRLYSQDLNQNLNQPYHYDRIVETCTKHQRPREAVQWAERGLKAFPHNAHLRSMLAELYANDGLDAEVITLIWQNFIDHASPQNYLKLKQVAGDDWPQWRKKAHETMQASERKAFEHPPRYARPTAPDCSIRLSCLLAENALEEARDIAMAQSCNAHVKLALARRIAAQHPLEAASHFQAVIPSIIHMGNNNAYAQAADLLRELAPCLPSEVYQNYIVSLKQQFKAKRNFISLLQ